MRREVDGAVPPQRRHSGVYDDERPASRAIDPKFAFWRQKWTTKVASSLRPPPHACVHTGRFCRLSRWRTAAKRMLGIG